MVSLTLIALSLAMDVEFTQLLELDTSVVFARTLTTVKFVKRDLATSIHSSKSSDLRMLQLQLSQVFMKMSQKNQSKLLNSHLLNNKRVKKSLRILSKCSTTSQEVDSEEAAEAEVAKTESHGEIWLISSLILLKTTLAPWEMKKERKKIALNLKANWDSAMDAQDLSGLRLEPLFLTSHQMCLKLSQVRLSMCQLRFKTRPSGLGREVVS